MRHVTDASTFRGFVDGQMSSERLFQDDSVVTTTVDDQVLDSSSSEIPQVKMKYTREKPNNHNHNLPLMVP
jgi:hypothetical protein